jgi:hypothetical protein
MSICMFTSILHLQNHFQILLDLILVSTLKVIRGYLYQCVNQLSSLLQAQNGLYKVYHKVYNTNSFKNILQKFAEKYFEVQYNISTVN